MVRPMVPNTGTRRVYLKTRSQTQNESSAMSERSTVMVDAGPCSPAKCVPLASEPGAMSAGLKRLSSSTL
jgi:hypothetical protein